MSTILFSKCIIENEAKNDLIKKIEENAREFYSCHILADAFYYKHFEKQRFSGKNSKVSQFFLFDLMYIRVKRLI